MFFSKIHACADLQSLRDISMYQEYFTQLYGRIMVRLSNITFEQHPVDS